VAYRKMARPWMKGQWKDSTLRACRSSKSMWLQGALGFGLPGTRYHHTMPGSCKVASPLSGSLQPSALPARLLPWLSSQPLALALLLSTLPCSSASPRSWSPGPPPPPPPQSLPPSLHSLSFQPPSCICLLQVFLLGMWCSFPPPPHR